MNLDNISKKKNFIKSTEKRPIVFIKQKKEDVKNNNHIYAKKESNNVSHGNFGTPHKKKPKRPRGSVSFKLENTTKNEEEENKENLEKKKKKILSENDLRTEDLKKKKSFEAQIKN